MIDFLKNKIFEHIYSLILLPIIYFLWNNTIILRISLILCALLTYITIKLFFKYKKLKEEIKEKYLPQDLFIEINALLSENDNLFREFSPNSDGKDPLKADIGLWHTVRNNNINTNNKKILELLVKHKLLIPNSNKILFEKMINHIIAFEAHIKDENISYTNHQFPKDFENFIFEQCQNINMEKISNISLWLKAQLEKRHIQVSSSFIFGSVLNNYYKETNDIDVILLVGDEYSAQLYEYTKEIKIKFNKKFKKNLQITLFSQKDQQEFNTFLNKLKNKMEIKI